MGEDKFTKYLSSIQGCLFSLNYELNQCEKRINKYRMRVRDGVDLQESHARLEENEAALVRSRSEIDKVKEFDEDIKQNWSTPENRVIGFIRWAPPYDVDARGYTSDLCVVELYKEKFKHLTGNVLSPGRVLVFFRLRRSANLEVSLFQIQNFRHGRLQLCCTNVTTSHPIYIIPSAVSSLSKACSPPMTSKIPKSLQTLKNVVRAAYSNTALLPTPPLGRSPDTCLSSAGTHLRPRTSSPLAQQDTAI